MALPEADQRRVVNGIYPAASTSSFTDIGTVRGHPQPVYDEKDKSSTMRAREPAKELHPPMHFRQKNGRRINESLEKNVVNDNGAWESPRCCPHGARHCPTAGAVSVVITLVFLRLMESSMH